MNLKGIITGAVLAGLVGIGIFGCSSKPGEQKKGIIVNEWVKGGYYNASVYLTSDTGRAWIMHDNPWIVPTLDSLFDAGDTVTIEKKGHFSNGLDYYNIVK